VAEQLTMPKLGFDMAEGTLINWTRQVGDQINKGDVIAEIETDKATIEIEAQAGGTLLKLLAEPGQVVAVGAPIAYVGEAGEAVPDDGDAGTPVSAQAGPSGVTPAESTTQATTADETREAATTEPEGAPGITQDVHEGETVAVDAQGEPGAARETEAAPPVSPEASEMPDGLRASPIARRIAEERGIDLRQVRGTGPNGRIVKKDVEEFQPGAAPAAPAPAAPAGRVEARPAAAAPAAMPVPSFGEVPSGPDVEVIDISRLRQRIGARMVESKQQVPHFYVTSDIDVTKMLKLRKQLNASITDEAQKISVNDLIVKATALTLRQFPNLNTHFYGDKLVRNKRIHIGIAVALPNGGLMNVVARDADKTALGTMAAQNRDMITRAREGKVRTDDVEGSTFTVSNLGPYDVEHFLAIINPPEAGILAVGSAMKVPVVMDDDQIEVRSRMKVTISVDHRVSDGAEAAEFMQAFKTLLENPMRLLV